MKTVRDRTLSIFGYPLRFRLIARFVFVFVCIFVTDFFYLICKTFLFNVFFCCWRGSRSSPSDFLYVFFLLVYHYDYIPLPFCCVCLFAIIITSFILFLSFLFLHALLLSLESTYLFFLEFQGMKVFFYLFFGRGVEGGFLR